MAGRKPRVSISFPREDFDPAVWKAFKFLVESRQLSPGKLVNDFMRETIGEKRAHWIECFGDKVNEGPVQPN